MARFLSLSRRACFSGGVVAGFFGLALCGVTVLRAESSMVPPPEKAPPPPETPAASTQKPSTPVAKAPPTPKVAKSQAPVVPPPPPPFPDTYNKYGKIIAPSDDVAHPIKLNVQFPGVGEIKIPSQEELNVRDKLEQLATLSDADIRAQLELWPPFAKMKLGDEGQLLMRIQQFKDQRMRIAMDKARELGIFNTLTPDQKVKFEKEYWDKRLQMDRELAKQFEPVFKARDQKMREELFREFSTTSTNLPGAKPPAPAKPGTPPPAQAKSPAPAASTTAQNQMQPEKMQQQ